MNRISFLIGFGVGAIFVWIAALLFIIRISQ